MADGVRESAGLASRDRHTLGALRYAVNDDAATYLAIMRLFTTGMAGFLSDQSADEIAEQLSANGLDLDRDLVDQRLSYLVEHGNLARSPRETEARSVREYLSNRARYQLTPRGELVHRQVEELLAQSEGAREVSSEMLPGILTGLEGLLAMRSSLDSADPRDVAARITTLFAQFEVLVTSTRQFYSYLAQVLTRFDLGRDEFTLFKTALVDYLQRFVDDVSRHMPQVADRLRELEPSVPALCARAGAGERLVGIDGTRARRADGLDPADWSSMHAWFVGAPGRRADAENVRFLATDAMRALLTNLRRIAAGADRQHSRYADLARLARWFDDATDEQAHELWAAAFGLYSARHLSFPADPDGDPVPATSSWWTTPVAEVPLGLRVSGDRRAGGRSGARLDFGEAKLRRLAERRRQAERDAAAVRELAEHAGSWHDVQLSDQARTAFLGLYSSALAGSGRPLPAGAMARASMRADEHVVAVEVRRSPGSVVRVHGPAGTLELHDLAVEVRA